MKTDILIVGAGCAGLYCALHLPKEKQVLIITKDAVRHSDSFLAQGGICMLKDDSDYESYFEDTMRAGHYENNPESVEIMIRSSQTVVKELIRLGVSFQREENGELSFTREGGHSQKRILFHEDITGKEITSKLLERVKAHPNVQILEYAAMLDLLSEDNCCYGAVVRLPDGTVTPVLAETTVLACGGIGGLYRYTTNYRHLTGDGIAVAFKHGVALEHINYVQIHPTTLYTDQAEKRSFLISESVRGEGAVLYNAKKERFVNELLPRDVLTEKIYAQMEKDKMPYVWLSMENIPKEGSFLYVGNHRSYFDIVLTYLCFPRPTGYVAKSEMNSIPLLSTWMRNIHCLFLDRKDMREGLKMVLTGIDHIKHGISICIFPEGTRNPHPEEGMMPFKEGSLKIAEKTGCPVIPVAISNTHNIFESHMPFIRKCHVIVEYGEPVLIKELDKEQRKFSGAYTRSKIEEMLKKHQDML